MKKVVILIPYWNSARTGGGVVSRFHYLYNELKNKKDIDLYIITTDINLEPNIISIHGNNKIFLFLRALINLLKISPTIIHCAEHGYMLLAAVVYKHFRRKIKLIYSFHTDREEELGDSAALRNKLWGWSVNRCDLILVASEYLLQKTKTDRSVSINKPVRIFPHTVKLKEYNCKDVEALRGKFDLHNKFPIICTIGIFRYEWKTQGVELLIQAFQKLDALDARLLIVGDGERIGYLKKMVQGFKLQDKINFVGFLDNPFIALSLCHIYCHLALKEAAGLAILEAMAMERPIVAAKMGGIPEIVSDKNNGLLVEPRVQGITSAIRTILDNPDFAKKIALNARIEVENKYAPHKFINTYLTDILGIR